MRAETIEVSRPPDVFDTWNKILTERPEVVKQTVKTYNARPHGAPDDQTVVVVPRERIVTVDNELFFFGNGSDVKSIGAFVEVRPDDFDPTLDYSRANRFINEGDILEIRPENQKSFVFVDFESPPSQESLQLILTSLKDWESDWYLLDSGGSFHLVINKLVDPKILPKYYGQLIMDISKNLSWPKSSLYGHIGKYLIENYNNPKKLKAWAASVLEIFGHIDDPSDTNKLVFPIDMRYFAHVVEAISNGTFDESYLRVSSKHGSVPVLIAQQTEGKVLIYKCQDDPFDRK